MAVLKKLVRRGGKKKIIKKVVKKVVKKTTKKTSVVKKRIIEKKKTPLDLKRSKSNPIIEPESNLYWESKASFNPTALYHDGKVHIIYRAIGGNDMSVLGYAKSFNGYNIEKNSKEAVRISLSKFFEGQKDLASFFNIKKI